RIAPMTVWHLQASGLRSANEVEVADDPTGRLVLRVPGRESLTSVRLVAGSIPDDALVLGSSSPTVTTAPRRRALKFQLLATLSAVTLAVVGWMLGSTLLLLYFGGLAVLMTARALAVR